MKLSLTISAVVASLILFQGCGSDDDKKTTPKTLTFVEGKTTLSSGLRTESKATVCFDKNRNNKCDTNEDRTQTDENGNYKLDLSNGITNGDVLIVFGGRSVLALTSEELNTLTFGKVFNDSETSQNINIVSSYVSDFIDDGLSYDEAIEKIVNEYDLDVKTILSNPLDNADNIFGEGRRYLEVISSLEKIARDALKGASKIQNKFFDDALDFVGLGDENTTDSNETSFLPSLDEVDDTISEYTDIFDDFFASLSDFFAGVVAIFILEDIDETADADLSFEGIGFQEIPLTREELTGTWFFDDSKGDKSCVYISKFDNVSTFEIDGNVITSKLSVEFRDENETDIKAIEFTYGLFSTDKILISDFRALHIFKG